MMSKKYTGTEAPVFDQRLEDLDIDEDTIDITDVEDDAEAHRHAEARRYVDMFVDPTVIERRRRGWTMTTRNLSSRGGGLGKRCCLPLEH